MKSGLTGLPTQHPDAWMPTDNVTRLGAAQLAWAPDRMPLGYTVARCLAPFAVAAVLEVGAADWPTLAPAGRLPRRVRAVLPSRGYAHRSAPCADSADRT